MKKLVLIGRSEAGKTTLTQALRGEKIHYHKTQYDVSAKLCGKEYRNRLFPANPGGNADDSIYFTQGNHCGRL